MNAIKHKIVITGGSGRFGSILKKNAKSKKIFFPKKRHLNILSTNSIKKYLIKLKPKILIHLAGLSRPMKIHENQICESIDLNIIGTANIVKVCSKLKIKLVYFSTNYVYPCKKGNYSEKSPLLPINNYAWSKLGGEAAVQMYRNSLILRACMTEKPFVHKKAFVNVKSNFIFHEDMAKILFKLINQKGIINIGGKTSTIYNFAKKNNSDVKKIFWNRKIINFPKNSSMDLSKLNKIISKKIR
jgi:dTDP-4-dehydrorhamnose reductase